MWHRRLAESIFAVGWLFFAAAVFGQDYPNKPVRIVTSPPGGGSDFIARTLAQGISGPLGQPMVIDNRATIVAPEIVFAAQPDGYTLLVIADQLWVLPLLQKTPYDAAKDFAPIIAVATTPLFLVVHPSAPARSVKDLIDLAKAKPGALNAGTATAGSPSSLAVELFKAMTGVKLVNITYKGSGPAVIALLGNEVQMMMDIGPGLLPHIKSGKLRALAVTSAKPSALLPDLPTIAATVPGYEVSLLWAVFAPARTPAAIVNRLNREMVKVLQQADVKEKFFNAAAEVVASSPEQLAAKMKSDTEKWGKLIKDAGIRVD